VRFDDLRAAVSLCDLFQRIDMRMLYPSAPLGHHVRIDGHVGRLVFGRLAFGFGRSLPLLALILATRVVDADALLQVVAVLPAARSALASMVTMSPILARRRT
jgi:hypothetical protein